MNILQLKAFAEQHNPWKCRAYSTLSEPLANGSFFELWITTIDFDPSGMVTQGQPGLVTIPVDGIYHVTVNGSMTSAIDGGRMVLSIFKNRAEWKRGVDWVHGGAGSMVGQCNAIMYCKAGDVLTTGLFTAAAGLSTVAGSQIVFISVAYLTAA